ncbi:sugar porter family MFS transporter [Siphonobacter aquaeclarae]|uniref:MFS transporter, sugar porter (SP) family n=1 Tax=Siphonobacter aquaeclarae TaxID=563176 RepID=A0A1G9KWK6_9BACT|nr:sugar porter family MFS transporter [Siphonobacter aquaeclarae]SDL53986.1 MFS transporter, sugar porter (SP) family [Siphonobacter aquaeclarae]
MKKVFLWSVVIALGGFLFGFDTAVISGAERAIQQLWHLDVFEHGLTVSIALIGTVLGALTGGIPSDRFGRRNTLFGIAALYLVSSIGAAVSPSWVPFLIFRFLGGLGVGASSVTAPLYISEISPARSRGKMVALFQFNVVFGILIAYLSNYLFENLGDNAWRWMLGVQAVPSLLFFLLLFRVPESPRWLITNRGDVAGARAVLAVVSPDTVDQDILAIQSARLQSAVSSGNLWAKENRFPVFLAIVFAFFNQVSGINAIIYYAPRIFEMAGLGKSSSLLSTAGIGLVNFGFTLLAMNVIDRFGRRTLMLIGSFGVIATLGLVSRAFYTQQFDGVPVFLFVYIAFFAFSQGAVIWVFISEIFPNSVRAKGQALGSFTHWLMATVIAFTFPYFAEKLGGGHTFLFFAVMMFLQLLFVWKVMPETKGTSLEQIEKTLVIH